MASLCLGVTGAAPTAAAADPVTTCGPIEEPVSVLLTQQHMRGTLCAPESANTVLVMVPGGTYNHAYWDFPYQESTYNFRKAMNAAGYATAVVDRLGSGNSSRPPSVLVTALSQAGAVHEVVQGLRNGTYGRTFGKVVIVGHSVGSSISAIEAGTYKDVDGVVLTGMTHSVNAVNLTASLADLQLASLDPMFPGYDPGYMTSKPNRRQAMFHDPGAVDPNVVATDEATKDVISAAETADALGVGIILPYTALINAPVLLAVGSGDRLFCGGTGTNCTSASTVLAAEAPIYPQAPSVNAVVQQGVGHDLNLHPSAPTLHAAVVSWLNAHI
ncbi:pimeloyl-ACP methyl ester carboxylesterase [Crossiella equi]|uniref:Pimeloyl-ACP methyl ester carboxylesterase n=1 Tax=Crossiella equi TaxID=130796 RepID=A0ABS5A9Q0_9PSEU|nr:alpha/beta fold hydrolase [Crossiella equi]MBP2473311.1 pimeloyl-ACP methyl ester carboxylesterase [Crossiella equi]